MMRRFWTAACAALLAIPAAAGGAGDRGEFTIFLNGANRGREKYHIETSAKKHYWGILSETFFKEPWPQAKRGYIDLHFYPEYYRDLGTGELLEYKYRMKVEDYAETDLVEADQSAREVVDQDRQLFDFSQQYKQNTQDVMQDRVDLGVNSGLLRRMANGLHFEQTKISLTRVKDEAARGPVLVLDPYAFALFIPLLDQLRGEGPVWSLPIALPQYMRFKPGRVEYNGILKVTVSGKPYFLKHYDVRVQDALYASFWTDKAGKIVQISVPKDGMMAVLARYTPAGFEKAEPRITRAVITEGTPFTERRVAVPSGALSLGATLTLPPGKGPFPAALLVQDLAAADRDGNTPGAGPDQAGTVRQLAYALAARGVASLRYDARGVGDSGGDADQVRLEDRATDIRALAGWLGGQEALRRDGLFLVASGMGGWPAAAAAATLRPTGVVFVSYPAKGVLRLWKEQAASISDPQAMQRAYSELDILQAELAGPATWVTYQGRRMFVPALRELVAADPVALLRTVEVPSLLAYPAKDVAVQPFHRDIVAPVLRAGQETLVLPGLSHALTRADEETGVSGVVDREGVKPLSDWILKRAGSAP